MQESEDDVEYLQIDNQNISEDIILTTKKIVKKN